MKWKNVSQALNTTAIPVVAVQAICVDPKGNMLTQHRSPNIRSARNVWSWITGLHEIGETVADGILREIGEESGLKTVGKPLMIGLYENIAGEPEPDVEQWHWVVVLFGVRVESCDAYVNLEPDKHDEHAILPFEWLLHDSFYDEYKYHSSFERFAKANREGIVSKLRSLIDD